jgi:hypothetical protein
MSTGYHIRQLGLKDTGWKYGRAFLMRYVGGQVNRMRITARFSIIVCIATYGGRTTGDMTWTDETLNLTLKYWMHDNHHGYGIVNGKCEKNLPWRVVGVECRFS